MSKRIRSESGNEDNTAPRARRPFRQDTPGTTQYTDHPRYPHISANERVLHEDSSHVLVGDGMLRARASSSRMDVQERPMGEHRAQRIRHHDNLQETANGAEIKTVDAHPPTANTDVYLHSTPARTGRSRSKHGPHARSHPRTTTTRQSRRTRRHVELPRLHIVLADVMANITQEPMVSVTPHIPTSSSEYSGNGNQVLPRFFNADGRLPPPIPSHSTASSDHLPRHESWRQPTARQDSNRQNKRAIRLPPFMALLGAQAPSSRQAPRRLPQVIDLTGDDDNETRPTQIREVWFVAHSAANVRNAANLQPGEDSEPHHARMASYAHNLMLMVAEFVPYPSPPPASNNP
ncbi:hypothetical protein DACRYDRAFT_109906 [Dacryopinax primogenitus]|uniref:Uncharacterized protein n=1 Tax=Dacryopinax primogenitus (strain DJM 731) TaxID=1858805 RepID=M5FQL2_DACPD|nr:uncharacterized protein DACRYDRAFT_109906 [Dacryopinax primogenitus]EJT99180.1 hypothetical protein DACRYDRAFT_109906 [Dacryopinax primogenitus]